MNAQTRAIAGPILAGLAVLAVLWFAAIAPKRSDNAAVRDNVSTQETRLSAAKTEIASNQSARKQFPGLIAELKRLDVAVPGRAAIADLLRELQRRARVSGSDLRLAALKSGGGAPAAGATAVTPGAGGSPGGLTTLPFTFEYNGKYFDLLQILRAVRKSVTVRSSGDLAIGGRLLTIDGVSFQPDGADASRAKATISATAYIVPEAAASPPVPAGTTSPQAPEGAASPQAPAGATTQGAK